MPHRIAYAKVEYKPSHKKRSVVRTPIHWSLACADGIVKDEVSLSVHWRKEGEGVE
jgi:hypothetical protein